MTRSDSSVVVMLSCEVGAEMVRKWLTVWRSEAWHMRPQAPIQASLKVITATVLCSRNHHTRKLGKYLDASKLTKQ